MEDDDDLRFSVIEEDSDGDSDAIDGVIDYEDHDDVFGGDDEISARKAGLRKKSSSSSLGAAVVTGRRHLEDIKQIMGKLKIYISLMLEVMNLTCSLQVWTASKPRRRNEKSGSEGLN